MDNPSARQFVLNYKCDVCGYAEEKAFIRFCSQSFVVKDLWCGGAGDQPHEPEEMTLLLPVKEVRDE